MFENCYHPPSRGEDAVTMSSPHPHHSDDFVAEEVERFTRACRERGTPVTQQRLAVYRALLQSHDHPDAAVSAATAHMATARPMTSATPPRPGRRRQSPPSCHSR